MSDAPYADAARRIADADYVATGPGMKDLGVTSGSTGGPGVGTFSGGTMTVPAFGAFGHPRKRSVRLVEAAHRRGCFSAALSRKTLADTLVEAAEGAEYRHRGGAEPFECGEEVRSAADALGVEIPATPVAETKTSPAAVVHEPPPVTETKADAVLGGVAVPGQRPRVLYTSGSGSDRFDWAGTPETPDDLDHKVGGLTIDIDDDLVVALVAVTGVVDEVADFAEPGCFDETLRLRIPKGVWSHDWDTWVSRTEAIEELMPGDGRLPKETRTGDPWPRTAGGLLVATRFNTATQPGSEGLSNVKFFDEGPLGPQTEWSIGYNVRPGRAFKTRDGVRHIQAWDVFEYGPVLFGAASLSGTLAIAGTKASAMRRDRRLRL